MRRPIDKLDEVQEETVEIEVINTDFSFLENHNSDCPNAQTSSCVIASITPDLANQIAEMKEHGIVLSTRQMPTWDERPRFFDEVSNDWILVDSGSMITKRT